MNLQKHIWEGWTVQDFIDDLDPILARIQCGASHSLILTKTILPFY